MSTVYRRFLRIVLIVLIILSFGSIQVQALPDVPGWFDTFADSTGINTTTNVTQVIDADVFGYDFIPYSGNPLLTLESSDPWDADGDPLKEIPGAVHADVLYFSDGMDGYKFWMIFTPGPETDSVPPGGTGSPDFWWERNTLVRSNDGINWEKTPDYTNPLVSPGSSGEWDDGWHADPDFVYAPGEGPNGESWFLYYTGCGGSGCQIALALSSDGKNYTKYSSNGVNESTPVAPAYRCPTVIYDDSTGVFHMWYNVGSFTVGYATSPDGINWTPYISWSNIVYSGTPGTYDQGGVSHMDVVYFDGLYHMYYLGMPTGAYGGLVIGHITSPDGMTWTQAASPALTPGSEIWSFWFDQTATVQSFYRPSVLLVEDELYMYYGGVDSYTAYPAYNYDIGLAFSTGPDGHVELQQQFNSSEYTPQADTLAWYHMNEGPYTPSYPGEYMPLDPTLAWYHLNETSGSAPDIGGDVADDGTVDGATWTTGLYSNGLSFDGNDRVTAIDSSDLNPQEAVTIEAWVNPSITKANNYVAIKMNPGSSDYAYGMKVESGAVGAFIQSPGELMYYSYGGSVPPDVWSHIAMTYEMNASGTSLIKLYLNGIEVTYSTQETIPANTYILTNDGPLTIGCIPIGEPIYYEGSIDEIRIVGRALTAEEIAADGSLSTPVVEDSSGNNHDGTPAGTYEWTTGLFSYGLGMYDSGYVTVPHSSGLDTSEQVTVEAWVNPAVNKANNYVAIKMLNDSNYAYALKLENQYTSFSEIGASIQDADGNAFFAYGGNVPVGAWSHIAMTYEINPTEATHIHLFLNGQEINYRYGAVGQATDTIPADTTIRSNTGPLNIGRIPVSSPLYFNGVMDELRILGRVLTPQEIASDYGNSYYASGSLTSILIAPTESWTWKSFHILDEQPDGTSIDYSVLNDAGSTLMSSIISGTSLTALGSTPIQFHADWTSSDPSATPFLYEWGGSWEGPTAVTISNFHVASDAKDIRVYWDTSQEIDLLGFNLYRSNGSYLDQITINSDMIQALSPGSLVGNTYSYQDALVEMGKEYSYKQYSR